MLDLLLDDLFLWLLNIFYFLCPFIVFCCVLPEKMLKPNLRGRMETGSNTVIPPSQYGRDYFK